LRRSAAQCDDVKEERQRCKLFLLEQRRRRRYNCRRRTRGAARAGSEAECFHRRDQWTFLYGEWAGDPHSTTKRAHSHTARRPNPSTRKRNLGTPTGSRADRETATARPHSSSTSRPRPDLPQLPPSLPSTEQSLQTSPLQTAMAAFTKLEDSPMFRKQVRPFPSSLPPREASFIGVPSRVPFRVSVGLARSRLVLRFGWACVAGSHRARGCF
jgi:hypothetical protein